MQGFRGLIIAMLIVGLAVIAAIYTQPDAGNKGNRPDGQVDNPLPPGYEPPRDPSYPILPDRIGYMVYVYERTAEGTGLVGLKVSVPLHDMRRASGRRDADREREYLDSIRNAITRAGHYAGKSEAWIANARSQIESTSLTSLASSTTSDCSGLYIAPEQISMECGGGGGGGGGGCGTIVCATTQKKDGKVTGCGGGCGDCSIVTVCG